MTPPSPAKPRIQGQLSPRRKTRFHVEQFNRRDIQALRNHLSVRSYIVDQEILQTSRCNDVMNSVLATLSDFEKLGEDGRWLVFDSFHERGPTASLTMGSGLHRGAAPPTRTGWKRPEANGPYVA